MDPSTSKEGEKLSETQLDLQNFFPKVLEDIKKIKVIEPGNQLLPLARIKKIMKLDEDVKMISAEAPLLFAKATEIFIHELTLRAWLHTEDNKRRTLQRNDIAMAISKYDQFDFLIDIVPRDEIKPKKEAEKSQTVQEQVFYVQAPSQQIQTVTVPTAVQAPSTPQTIQLQNTTTSPSQNIILQSPTQAQTLPTSLIQIGSPNQQIQLVQQVMSPNGEITQIPVQMTQQQLSMLRSQMAGTPLIVQAPQTIFQTASGQNIAIPIANLGQQIQYINPQAATLQQQQQQQAQQHQGQQQTQVKEENQH